MNSVLRRIERFRHKPMINTITDVPTGTQPFSLALSLNCEKTKSQTLYWQQPKRLQSDYLLRSQDHILGGLQFQNERFINRAIAKTTEKEWDFKYTHLSLPKVTIQKKNELVAQAIMEPNWGWYGTLIIPDGCRYTWKPTSHTENEFCFLTPDNYPVVFFRPHTSFLKFESEVEIDHAVLHNPHLPLLTMLGWFLVLLRLC